MKMDIVNDNAAVLWIFLDPKDVTLGVDVFAILVILKAWQSPVATIISEAWRDGPSIQEYDSQLWGGGVVAF